MIQLPVRVELRVRTLEKSTCSFTIISYPFAFLPNRGDHIVFENKLFVTVSQCIHFGSFATPHEEDPITLVVTNPYFFDEYDSLLRSLDWFKDNYHIDDISAEERPAPYYSFYRSLLRLLGWVGQDKLSYDKHIIKLFSEGCRTILLAERFLDSEVTTTAVDGIFGEYSDELLKLNQLVLSKKVSDPQGVDILNIIKEWEIQFNPNCSIEWSADLETCQQVGRIVFNRIHSLPGDIIPEFVKETK